MLATDLAQLDIPADYSGKVHAAVAVCNPDTASNVTVTVPGLRATIKDTLPKMVKESWNMQDQAERQLQLAGEPASVANISWVGYDPPPNPINTMSPRDAWAAINADEARTGAANLSTYLEQVRDNSPSAHVTLLGHSYGSLTSSLALQELNAQGLHPVNDVVFYGSPGLGLTDPAQQLGLGAGHAYVMGDASDPIVSWAAPVSDVHGWGDNPYNGMLPQLSAQDGTDPTGVYHPGIDGHADYTRLSHDPATGQDLMRMSQYNLAAIAAGLPDNAVMATPQLPPPQPHAPLGPAAVPPARHRIGRQLMRRSILQLAAVVCLVAVGCGKGDSGNRYLGDGGGAVSPEQIAQLENELRAKPSFEAARTEYQVAMRAMADQIIALVPGLRWHVDENSWSGCGGPYSHTRGKQVDQRIVFTGPIPDNIWPQALQIVKDGAARFDATHLGIFHDRPGFHDIYLAGPDGIDFQLGTKVKAVLSAKSDCRISETVIPSRTAER